MPPLSRRSSEGRPDRVSQGRSCRAPNTARGTHRLRPELGIAEEGGRGGVRGKQEGVGRDGRNTKRSGPGKDARSSYPGVSGCDWRPLAAQGGGPSIRTWEEEKQEGKEEETAGGRTRGQAGAQPKEAASVPPGSWQVSSRPRLPPGPFWLPTPP